VAAVVIGTHSADVGEGWQLFAAGAAAFGAVFLVMGYRAPRRGIDADENGLRVTNMFSHRDLRWEQLRDIHFEPVQNEIGVTYYHHLVMYTDSGRVVAQAPGGTTRPGRRLDTARATLLAMRDKFAHAPAAATDEATNEEPSAPADASPESEPSHQAGPRLPLPEGFEPPATLRVRDPDMRWAVVWQLAGALLWVGGYLWFFGDSEQGYSPAAILPYLDPRRFAGTYEISYSYQDAFEYLVDQPSEGFSYLLLVAGTLVAALAILWHCWRAGRVMRLGVDADRSGMVITNMYRRHAIPWSDVEDITDEAADGDPPVWHRLQIVAGERLVPSHIPMDRGEPDGPVGVARQTLLAMRDVFTARETSDEPVSRPSFAKRRLLIPAGILALALAGFAMSRTLDQPGLTAANGPPPSPSAPTTAADDSPSSTPKPTHTVKPVVRMGSPVRDDKLEFTAEAIECGISEFHNAYYAAKAKGEFCSVSLTVANVVDEWQQMFSDNQYAIDAHGRRFLPDRDISYEPTDSAPLFLRIFPGTDARGRMYFDVPKGSKITKLELHDSLDSLGVVIRLS
jgi:hypothetical protein